MNAGQILQAAIGSVIGTILGGGIVLLTIRMNAAADRKRAAQEWYEKTYITEGIDRVLSYAMNLEILLLSMVMYMDHSNLYKQPETINPISMDALYIIRSVLGIREITDAIIMVGLTSEIPDKSLRLSGMKLLKLIIEFLLIFREELIKQSISEKHQVYQIMKKIENTPSVLEKLEKVLEVSRNDSLLEEFKIYGIKMEDVSMSTTGQ